MLLNFLTFSGCLVKESTLVYLVKQRGKKGFLKLSTLVLKFCNISFMGTSVNFQLLATFIIYLKFASVNMNRFCFSSLFSIFV